MRNPPVLVVSALIAAYPEAASIKCDGSTPLHFALKFGASLDVIQTLILANPSSLTEKDENDNTVLAIYVKNKNKWKNESEKDAIFKVLNDGVDSIVLGNDDDNFDRCGCPIQIL